MVQFVKQINVVAAIILNEGSILATQRGYGDFKGGWEFPGGKIEPGESSHTALIREIHEELNADITIEQPLCHVEYDYDSFQLSMDCFICTLQRSGITLLEHEDARWLNAETIDSVDWLPADIQVVEAIKASIFNLPA